MSTPTDSPAPRPSTTHRLRFAVTLGAAAAAAVGGLCLAQGISHHSPSSAASRVVAVPVVLVSSETSTEDADSAASGQGSSSADVAGSATAPGGYSPSSASGGYTAPQPQVVATDAAGRPTHVAYDQPIPTYGPSMQTFGNNATSSGSAPVLAPNPAAGAGQPQTLPQPRVVATDAAGRPTHVAYDQPIPTYGPSMQTFGNNSPYVPLQYDTNHVRSNTTVNTQTPTTLGGAARQPVGANNPVTLGLQNKINQDSTDSMTRIITGVTVDRHGTSTDFFGANSKPFNNFGDALSNVRANDPTR